MHDTDRIAQAAVSRITATLGKPHTSPGRWRWEINRADNRAPVSLAIIQTDRGAVLAQLTIPDDRLSSVTGVLLDSTQAIESLRSRLLALLDPAAETAQKLN